MFYPRIRSHFPHNLRRRRNSFRSSRDISTRSSEGTMTVVNQKETRADLGEVAEAGIHLPEPTHARSHISPEEEHDHEHGFELVEVLRVIFVALAAAAVWFHLWEPFHRVSVIG